MGLRLSSIRAGILAAALSISATGCKKAPAYKILPHEFVPAKALNSLDSIRKSGVEIISNPEFKFLGVDTVKLEKDFVLNPQKFMEEQNKALENKYTEFYITDHDAFCYSRPDGGGIVDMPTHSPKYIDKTTVIKSENLYTANYLDTYVPVEHYGRINPKVVPFLNEDNRNIFQIIRDFFK